MKFIRTFFSMIGSVSAAVFGPIWNHPKILRMLANVLLLISLLVITAWGLVWLAQRPAFTLTHLTVESLDGRELKHVNLLTIKSRAIEEVKGNFFTVSLDQARQAFEAMPWVRKASVRRDWPNGIVVAIEEHQALGVWANADNTKLMNTYGELFVVNMAEIEASLFKLSGPIDSNKEVFNKLKTINYWLEPIDVKVLSLNLSSRYAWNAILNDGTSIDLGRELDGRDAQQIELSVKHFVKTWPQVKEKWGNRVDSIDLRYANGYAIHIGKK